MRYITALFLLFAAVIVQCDNAPVKSTQESPGQHPKSTEVMDMLDEYAAPLDQVTFDPCEEGTMVGDWIRDDIGGETGTFYGTWYDQSGEPTGLFNGQFWTISNGVRLFYGSVSGYITDQVIAEMFGSWFYDDPRMCPMCGTGHGQFRGIFFRLAEPHSGIGLLKGEFGYADDVMNDTLPLTGSWKWYCNFMPWHTSNATE
jgi:hypothetical protein